MRDPRPLFASAVCLVAVTQGCQEGGSSLNASSEVKLAIDHHMTSLGGQIQFKEGFPINESTGYTDLATLHFKDDGKYTLSRPGQQTSSPESYFLSKAGALTMTVLQRSGPALRWPGSYDLQGDLYFFVSREPSFLRIFVGVRQLSGTPTIADAWHVLGDTLVFASANDAPSPDRVGRAYAGSITFDKDGKITDGGWKDSTSSTVIVTGTLKTVSLGFADLALDLKGGPSTGTQTFSGGIAKHVGLLVDKVATDKHVGMLCMIRKQTAAADPKRVAGDWRVGVHAIFPTPGQSGADVAMTTLTLETTGNFVLKFDGNSSQYKGTYRLEDKGGITLTETGKNQAWVGAIDPDYRAIAFADTTLETGGQPFVGLFIGIKQ